MIRGVRMTAFVVGMFVIIADLLFAWAAYVSRQICDQSTCSGDPFWPVLIPLIPGVLLAGGGPEMSATIRRDRPEVVTVA